MASWSTEWTYPQALLGGLGAITLIALLVLASTSATAFGTYNPAWDGASDLRALARDTGAESTVATAIGAYDETTPDETVAVILAPADAYSDAEAARIRAFLERGGTVVVADDFGSTGNALLADLGAQSRINGTILRDERSFHRSPALPKATNVSTHPLTEGVQSVTLNHGSAVEPNGATVLVRTSGFAYADRTRNDELDDNETLRSYPVITAESVGNGTLVVAGDPSLFINVMLEQPGNEAFVRNLFAVRSDVLLDYSQAGAFPPLALALLVLRQSVGLQIGIGVAGLGAIGLWASGRYAYHDLLGQRQDQLTLPDLSEEELVSFLERRHPEWDDERVRRVVRGLISRPPQSRQDD